MFLDFMQDTTAIPSMIIWTALNMQGYVEEKYTLCCVVSIVCIILIKKIYSQLQVMHLGILCEIDRSS